MAGASSPAIPQAGQAPSAAGHWTGMLDTPAQALDLEVDLKPGTPPAWVGTISIAVQNLKAFPLSVEVQGTSVSFVMANVPGTPTFKGTLAADGTSISGDFSQGGGSLPLKLTRKSDAVFTEPAKSTAITKEFEGAWSGSLAVPGGKTLRLALKLANGADAATGSMVSIDQGSGEIPISTITQAGTHLTLVVQAVNGSYSGELKDGKLVGTWTQGPGSLPLEFVRAAP